MLKTKKISPVVFSALRLMQLFSTVIISFFMMPFLINHLGNHYYGIWILVSVFSGYYGMMDLGLSTATQRYIAQAIGKGAESEINQIISTAIISYSFLAFMVLLLGGVGYIAIPFIFKWKPEDINLLRGCFLVMLGGLTISFPFRSFTGLLGAALRQDISAKVDMLYVFAKTVGTILVVLKGYSILYIAYVTAIVDVLYYVFIVYLVHQVYTTLRISFKLISVVMVKKLFKYTFFSFINKVSDLLKFRVDNVVISMFLLISDVTIYNVAFRLFEYFNEIIVSAVGFSDPYFSRYEGAGNYTKLSMVFGYFTKISTILSVFIGVSLLLYGKYFILCWVGNDFVSSYSILICLVIPGMLIAMQDPLRRIFFATSKHHMLAYISLIEGAVNVILSVIFVQFYGLIGVALGTAIPSVITALFIIPFYGCSIMELSLKNYWFKSVLFPASVTTIFVICFTMLIRAYLTPNFGIILVWSLIQLTIFIPFCFFIFLNKSERNYIIDMVRKRVSRS
jgi:O-antigen/teichoic acid export membrane protein